MTVADWRPARVLSNERACEHMISLLLEPEERLPHQAGQHYELRMPGGAFSRKYSIVSPPEEDERLEFGIQILASGLVSPQLAATGPGDRVEVRGPLGQAFVWTPERGQSLLLLGGGAGITPLLSMFAHAAHWCPGGRRLFLMSAKSPERIYRYDRFESWLTTRFTATEERLNASDLSSAAGELLRDPQASAWVCGPPGFIDTMVDSLLELGFPEMKIRSEAFV